MTPQAQSHHRKRAQYYSMVFGQCLEDTRARHDGKDVNYLLDYSLLHAQWFEGAALGTKPPLLSTREVMEGVLSQAAGYDGFQLIVSSATILEFEDTLRHMVDDLQLEFGRMPSLRELREEAKPGRTLQVGARIDRLHSYLAVLTQDGRAARITRPIAELLRWMDDGTIEPASQVVDMATLQNGLETHLFEQLVAEHHRTRFARDPRDLENAEFHYKLDALNVLFTRAAQGAAPGNMRFVTPTPLNTEQCADGAIALGRSQETPLWRLNAAEQCASGVIGDVQRYFHRGEIEGQLLADDIPADGSDAKLPSDTLNRVLQFYGGTVGLIAYTTPGDRAARALSRDDVVRMEETLASPRRIRETRDEIVEEIRSGAQTIDGHIGHDEIAYLQEFRFDQDPITQKVRAELGLEPL